MNLLCATIMQTNALSAVLYALIGMMSVALASMIGFCIMRNRAEHKNLERYVYVREEIRKSADCENDDANKESETRKKRHGKNKKNK